MEKTFSMLYFPLFALVIPLLFQFQSTAAATTPATVISGTIIKHLSSFLKWTSSKSSPKSSQSEGPVVQFENGYLVETVVEGNALGVVPYSIRVSQDGELFAVDSENSNIVRITPPLSQYSRARLVAGSFQGKTGHADGKSNDARFNHPRGVTMDDKGNVYVADTDNLAIRKIGEGGVTTIAGGKSNVAGYRDGPSEDAKFSTDFDVVYVPSTCSLLVVDRGNAAIRQISLNQEDCDANSSAISASDILMVVAATIVGYASCLLQQGLGPSFFSNLLQHPASDVRRSSLKEKKKSDWQSVKQDQGASPRWPPAGQLVTDVSSFALKTLKQAFGSLFPSGFSGWGSRKGLTPLKDTLKMPEDQVDPHLAKKQKTPVPPSETWQAYAPNTVAEVKASEIKPDPSLPNKHRSSKRHEYAEFYGTSEAPQHAGQSRPRASKERSKHRHRDKSGEVPSLVHASQPRPSMQPNYVDPRFDPYNVRNKIMPDGSYRY